MPIASDKIPDMEARIAGADRVCLITMALALLQVAVPACPRQTGELARSHGYLALTDSVKVGVSKEYGGYVHNGTSRQKARPWLRKTANANKRSIAAAGVSAWKRAMM